MVWLKLGILRDTTEIIILMLVYVTLTVFQGHRDVGKKDLCTNCLTEFKMNLDEI